MTVAIGRLKRLITAVVMDRAVASINVPGLSATHHMLKQKKLKLADHNIDQDLLTGFRLTIGADYYGEFVKHGVERRYGIYLTRTPGGYMVFGPLGQKQFLSSSTVTSNRVTTNLLRPESLESLQETAEFNREVPKLWELDTIGIDPKASKPDDDLTYKKYLQTVQHDNTLNAKGNLDTYDDLIQTQLQTDFIEFVYNATPVEGGTHYLPHHAVKKDSISTPLRIVFNCSAKVGSNPSLNDCLLTGPTLTTKLRDTLLDFRTQKYGIVGDISKAFLRIGLQTCDRDFTRFLWFSDPHDPNSSLVTYCLKAVLFRATCSTFLFEATLETHFKESASCYKEKLHKGFYIHNLQITTSDIKELHSTYEEANTLMAQANMPL